MFWWVWVLVGLALLGLEVLTPGGFVVFFFGIAALVVGLMVGLGAGGPAWVQWLLFSGISVLSLVLFRSPLLALTRSRERDQGVDTLTGEVAIPVEELAPGAVGKAELRGTTWTVQNADPRPLAKGQRCRVTRVDGLMLRIRAE